MSQRLAYAFATIRFRELYFIGGYGQFLAWALYPWVLFSFRQLALKRSRAAFIAAVGFLAALILTHNISALLFLPVFVAYVLLLQIRSRSTEVWRLTGAAAILGLALAAILWLPALAEASYTRVNVLTQGVWDVAANFLRPGDLIAAVRPLDDRAVLPLMPFTFGRLHLFLAAIGALTLIHPRLRAESRLTVGLALIGTVLFALMMLPFSLVIWRFVPLLRFTEFPWRMYGPAFLLSSVLCGASLLWLDRLPRVQAGAAVAAALALILAVAVYQFPRPFLQVPASIADYLRYETGFHAMGTTAGGEYLSRWTAAVPAPPALTPDLSRMALLNPAPGQTGTVVQSGPGMLRLHVSQPAAGDMVVAQFFFPGWQAKVDGAPATVAPAAGSGAIKLAVPAGEHDISLEFTDTPVRRAGRSIVLVGGPCGRRDRVPPAASRPGCRHTAPGAGALCGGSALPRASSP